MRLGMTDTTIAAANTDGSDGQQQTNEAPAFEAITSQDALDRIISTRINRVKSQFADYDDLKAAAGQVDGLQARVGELEATNADLDGRVKGFEAKDSRRSLVAKVAEAAELAPAVVESLRGDTEDELTAAAAALKGHLQVPAPFIPGQANRPGEVPVSDTQQFAKSLFNSN